MSDIPILNLQQANEPKITIICSIPDQASQNIKNHLLSMWEWTQVKYTFDGCPDVWPVYEFENFRIVEIDKYHIYQDGIDEKLINCGLPTKVIIFASKHKSNDGRKLLTAHFTGNVKYAEFGGRPQEFAKAAPYTLRSLLKTMHMLAKTTDYTVSMESTHHGPTHLNIPSVYVEIGSDETQWNDPVPGEIIASAIMSLDQGEVPVAMGFGGGHYAPRQSKLLFETNITFGHNFPSYQLQHIDKELTKQAFENSGADFVYFDRKSMPARERDRIGRIVEKLGYEVLREGDIREMDEIPLEFFKQVHQMANEFCPGGRAKFTDGMKSEIKVLDLSCRECKCPKVNAFWIDRELMQEAETVDKKRIRAFLDSQNIAYIERSNGTVAHVIFSIDDNCTKVVTQKLTNECIQILKERYEIKYIPDENILCIIDNKFNPELARELGVPSGPMFGELTGGKTITVNGKTITPEMVYQSNRKNITLTNTIDL
ncbi:MAG: D-aminoacyl-tRNA deacylase [Methanosarcinaceae archaeon]